MQTDQLTPERVQEFETEALPHMDNLFRVAVSKLGDKTEAEDVVQETYLQAWKSFHRFTPGTNCKAWLFRILFHVLCHHRQKWFRIWRNREDLEELEDSLAYQPPVPDHLTDDEVLGAFRRLPQKYAEVLILADVYEFSYEEIRLIVDIPLGTVMSRISRGRNLLRVSLAGLATGSRNRASLPVPERRVRIGQKLLHAAAG